MLHIAVQHGIKEDERLTGITAPFFCGQFIQKEEIAHLQQKNNRELVSLFVRNKKNFPLFFEDIKFIAAIIRDISSSQRVNYDLATSLAPANPDKSVNSEVSS